MKLIHISLGDTLTKANYQDMQRFMPVDLPISGDAEASLPMLTEAVKREAGVTRRLALADRANKLRTDYRRMKEGARTAASNGWDATPVSTARVSATLWNTIKNEQWCVAVSSMQWNRNLFPATEYYNFLGGSGGSGVGYGAPAAVGAALANRDKGIITVSIEGDGDLMYAPGVLWTAAHHRIPLLSVMHNNRAYHQEVMHIQRMANRHQRGITNAGIGTTITDPNIDYATIARGMGVYGEGPITDPKDLAPALRRAMAVVERGEPALVDVVTQPR